ncbi:MAG: DUF1697 domain-containing protein [bacterium]
MKINQIALIRGINVGSTRKLPMADLRALATGLGFAAVRTYIQSGNLLYATALAPEEAAGRLEAALAAHLGYAVGVIAVPAAAWADVLASNPFPEVAEAEPTRLHAVFTQQAPPADAADRILAAARGGERVVVTPAATWVHFPTGVGTSKITPALLDRALGGPATARGWRTLQAIEALLDS